jgi:hypothetical protein
LSEQLCFLPEPVPAVEPLDYQFTPRHVLLPLHDEFRFTLDPCSQSEAFSASLMRHYAEPDNGLAQPWAGERVWLNPPYSNVGPWLAKGRAAFWDGLIDCLVALLPSFTDRRWWHANIELDRRCPEFELRFLKGRFAFGCPGNPDGVNRGAGQFPSCIAVWNRRQHGRVDARREARGEDSDGGGREGGKAPPKVEASPAEGQAGAPEGLREAEGARHLDYSGASSAWQSEAS